MFINKCEIESKELLVLRDLNCDWNKTPLDSHTQKLKNICVLYQLSQIIDEPTRVTKSSATQIDLILANNPESISNHGVIEIGISDHSFDLCCHYKKYGTFCSRFSCQRLSPFYMPNIA